MTSDRRTRRWTPGPWALGALAFGTLITAALCLMARRTVHQRLVDRMNREVLRMQLALESHILTYEDVLVSARGYHTLHDRLDREQWATYVKELHLDERHPEFKSLATILEVPREQLPAFLAEHPELGGAVRAAVPAENLEGPREASKETSDLMVIVQAEPRELNPDAMGLDVGSIPAEREAAELARDTGRPSLTGPLFFRDSPPPARALGFFLPLYGDGPRPQDPEARRRAFKGWISVAMLAEPMIQEVLRGGDPDVAFALVDTTDPAHPVPLYGDMPVRAMGPLDVSKSLYMAGRRWFMVFSPRPALLHTPDRFTPLWVALGGAAVTLSLAGVLGSLTLTRARALALAERMTHSLRDALQRSRSHVENTPLAVVEWDPQLHVMAWNPSAERIFGYSAAEVLEWSDAAFLLPDATKTYVRELRKGGDPISGASGNRATNQVLTKDGRVILCDWYNTALWDDSGRLIGITSLVDDVTERKRTEHALLQPQKLESLGVLAGGIAHDFNNLLTAILGNAELALDCTLPDAPMREHLQRIEATARRASDLAQQMLAYAGKAKVVVKSVRLNEVVEEMTELLAVSISKKARIRYELQPDLPPIEGDLTQLQQVVMNLVTNASEAIGDHPGTIVIRSEQAHLSAADVQEQFPGQDLPPGECICLSIADDGCGMDAATQARIFDPFFTTKFTGRGLGLSALQGIARGHRAGLRVESAVGAGTTFTVVFPAGAAESTETDTIPGLAPPAASGTILVVDDEEIVRDLAVMALEHAGCRVLAARDGLEAVELYRERGRDIDVVLMDMTMPRMDGGEAFRVIRDLDPKARVILSSGYTEQESLQALEDLAPDGFIHKPYRVQELVAKVRAAL